MATNRRLRFPPMQFTLVNIDEAAEILGLSYSHAYHLLKASGLQSRRLGQALHYDIRDVKRFAKTRLDVKASVR
jgi:hypothetical protein